MTVPVKKGIPIPEDIARRFGAAKYPWVTMDVGDSFEFAGVEWKSAKAQARHASKKYGRTFVVGYDVPTGVTRCWRKA